MQHRNFCEWRKIAREERLQRIKEKHEIRRLKREGTLFMFR